MRSPSWLARTFGWLVGTSPGSGMALVMIVFGLLTILTLLYGYVVSNIRNLEDLLPDHDQLERLSS